MTHDEREVIELVIAILDDVEDRSDINRAINELSELLENNNESN